MSLGTMLVSAALVLLFSAVAAGVAALGRFLGRPIPRTPLVLFFVLGFLPFPEAFVSEVTPLPIDHAMAIRPWHVPDRPPPHNPYLNDIATQIMPWAKAVRLAGKDLSLPFRNPWNGCGTPLAANSQSAPYSPLTVIGLLLPLVRAFTLQAATKLLLAMTGTWLWLRELGASSRASVFASVTFAFSLSFTPWLFFPNTAVLCLWPWMLFLVELCRDPLRRGRATLALAGVFAFAALAGHPENVALGCLFAGLWIVGRRIVSDLPELGAVTRSIALAASVALGLTAFFLVPSLLAIAGSNRAAVAATPFWHSQTPWVPHGPAWRNGLLMPLFPHALGDAVESPMISGAQGAFPEMALGYFGIGGWAAALLMLRPGSPRRRAEWILAALIFIGLAVAVALWPFVELAGKIPGIRLMFPLRFYSWIPLAGCAIAALELDRYAADLPSRRTTALAGALVPLLLAAAAVAVYVRFRAEHAKAGGYPFQKRQVILILGVMALAVLLALATRRRPPLFVAGLTLLSGAELLHQGRGLYRLHASALLYPETPLTRFLRAQPGPFRVVGAEFVLFPNTSIFAGLEDVRTHDATEPRDYVEFLDATCGYPPADYFKRIGNVNAAALDFLNVRYLLMDPHTEAPDAKWRPAYAGDDGTVFENAHVVARAFVPARIRLVRPRGGGAGDGNAAFGELFAELASLRDWTGRAYVLADRDGEIVNGPAEVAEYRESGNTAFLDVRAPAGSRDTFVVLSLFQDGGWSARDESGRPVPALRANGPFLALRAPPGEHRVRLDYRPPGSRPGTVISVLTLGLLVAVAAVSVRRRRTAVT